MSDGDAVLWCSDSARLFPDWMPALLSRIRLASYHISPAVRMFALHMACSMAARAPVRLGWAKHGFSPPDVHVAGMKPGEAIIFCSTPP
jgi:hypothetical protein